MVIWITGLSGSGKTSLAKELISLNSLFSSRPILLDGDEIRSVLYPNQQGGVDLDSRLALAFKYSRLAKIIADQNQIVIVSTISLFDEIHSWNRENISSYFEIYLHVPLHELIRRDSKLIYSRYYNGQLKHVAGLDIKIDEPKNPNYTVKFIPGKTVKAVAHDLYHVLKKFINS